MGAREPIPTSFFALVVVRRDREFLVVQERKFDQTFYVPGGRVDAGETFAEAAIRETKEEAGIDVVLEGVLRIEHTPSPSRVRAIFLARPSNADAPLKSTADEHSLGARWVTRTELEALALRGEEVRAMFEYVALGGQISPMSVLSAEGNDW